MAASGSSAGRAAVAAPFDFHADDVLCSYDDLGSNQDHASRARVDPSTDKDVLDSKLGRPLVRIYEEQSYSKEDIYSAIERAMKKYADNLLRPLEGISGRLSQLEMHCYKLERSVGDFRSDMLQEQRHTNLTFNSLEKHLQEVHRSIQILRDKQELSETQKELTKLQFVQKESSKKNEDGLTVTSSVSDVNPEPAADQQLAIVLASSTQQQTQQTVQQTAVGSLSSQQSQYAVNPGTLCYPHGQSLAVDSQRQQVQQPEPRYVQAAPQAQTVNPVQSPLQAQSMVPMQASTQQPQPVHQNQMQHYTQYPLPWTQQTIQQLRQQVAQPQQNAAQQLPAHMVQAQQQFLSPVVQPPQPQAPPQLVPQPSAQMVQPQQQQQATPHSRPQSPMVYPAYPPNQPTNLTSEAYPGNIQTMQQPAYATMNQPGGPPYGGPEMTPHQQTLQQSSYVQPTSKNSYTGPAPYPPPSANMQGYSSVAYSGYHLPPPARSQPYGEMIEKAVAMGYPRDHVVTVIRRTIESGEGVDFNSLLDRLNDAGSAGRPRAW